MFIEKRKTRTGIKYYLAHSYRDKDKIKKIRKYLGRNLSKKELIKKRKEAEKEIKKKIKEIRTEVFNFSLKPEEIKKLNKLSEVEIYHLDKKDWKRFTEDFVYNTNAIEGSTVNLNEVKTILQKKPKIKNSEEKETLNVAEAIKFIKNTNKTLSLYLIKEIHKICFKGSKPFAGEFRDKEVVIRNSKGEIIHHSVSSDNIEGYMKEIIEWYKENKNNFNPIVLASIIHNQFEHIHPFEDGNGRVGRLLLNFVLLRNNYPPINIYLEDRKEYYDCLKQYSDKQKIKPTVKFLIKQYKKTLDKVTT
ncbi:Fic family protein [Candidatus Woesearchaeota archaeon]|nr:Fic family protein [Candidatus Woesearchaeota archaeon]